MENVELQSMLIDYLKKDLASKNDEIQSLKEIVDSNQKGQSTKDVQIDNLLQEIESLKNNQLIKDNELNKLRSKLNDLNVDLNNSKSYLLRFNELCDYICKADYNHISPAAKSYLKKEIDYLRTTTKYIDENPGGIVIKEENKPVVSNNILTINEVAELIGCPVNYVYTLRGTNKLTEYTIEAVDRFLSNYKYKPHKKS